MPPLQQMEVKPAGAQNGPVEWQEEGLFMLRWWLFALDSYPLENKGCRIQAREVSFEVQKYLLLLLDGLTGLLLTGRSPAGAPRLPERQRWAC
jgi:hypothetical protein